MKVLLINGSPHEKGTTYGALSIVAETLETEGIDAEIFFVGTAAIHGCTGCSYCRGHGRCVFTEDSVNSALEKAETADGFVFGTPVHFAGASGMITSFMDRFFYASHATEFKPAAAIAVCRRAGGTSTMDQLNRYFTIRQMPVVASSYWNVAYGNTPEEMCTDLEGVQTMQVLGKNMAWLLKSIDAGRQAGIQQPKLEHKARTNFIR